MKSDRGQGANNALYDSYCFVEAMKAVQTGTPLQQAVKEYDEKIVKRGTEEVQISKAQTFFTHDWENFINSPVVTLGTKPSHAAKTEGYDDGKAKVNGH
jgi:2-polyprenyl-6-methoxyphenol hydroxylase-like FAD-dependent oxidoreductase